MGQKGELFELIDRAPAHFQTFEGKRWTWVHHERSRRAFEALANRAGANVSHQMIGSGPIEETLDRHDQVWIELPNRWRIDGTQLPVIKTDNLFKRKYGKNMRHGRYILVLAIIVNLGRTLSLTVLGRPKAWSGDLRWLI